MSTFATLLALLSVTGDFDFDGKQDVARTIANGQHFDIVLERGATGQRETLTSGPLSDPFLQVNAQAGIVPTACGKGLGTGCAADEPATVRLRGGELIFGQREATRVVMMPAEGTLHPIALSD